MGKAYDVGLIRKMVIVVRVIGEKANRMTVLHEPLRLLEKGCCGKGRRRKGQKPEKCFRFVPTLNHEWAEQILEQRRREEGHRADHSLRFVDTCDFKDC